MKDNWITVSASRKPTPRMTDKEFQAKHDELTSQLPEEFRGVVSHKAWEDGHSAGYEEVICQLSDLVDMLVEPIRLYSERIGKK